MGSVSIWGVAEVGEAAHFAVRADTSQDHEVRQSEAAPHQWGVVPEADLDRLLASEDA